MHFVADLRYVVPPLVNLTLLLFIPQPKPPNIYNEIFVMACLSLAIAVLLFLFTSVKLPLTVGALQLRAGDFSAPLTLSLLASIFFPSPLFWFVFPILVILSPWYEMLWGVLKRLMLWFCDTLQSIIPALLITCIAQRPQLDLQLEAIQIEGNNETNYT
ncbi:hypothetical protein FH972_012398 [Carpinus fangiana]|uniref:Uncharacterized protein n=1 Tax=Carpinus fangiana TaxID=176857 RepID=A0A5N6R6U4_9ROSI|nr:hypothetical protein FH972_012398 [Carpinus fangiana]